VRPLRLILWPSLNGAEAQHFWPNPGNLGAMSVVTEPLKQFQQSITFVRGVDITGSFNHMAIRSMFTGFPIADYGSPDPNVQSVDQVVADAIAATRAHVAALAAPRGASPPTRSSTTSSTGARRSSSRPSPSTTRRTR
jgi:hypothetical protein